MIHKIYVLWPLLIGSQSVCLSLEMGFLDRRPMPQLHLDNHSRRQGREMITSDTIFG